MGIIRKLLQPFIKDAEHYVYQAKSLIKADKISRGEKILAPKHPTDEKHFKAAQQDLKIKEEVNRYNEGLVDNVQKIEIKSFDPPSRPISNRLLPLHENESMDKYDQKFEYGFYEPSLDKMEKGRIMFREAMELLQAKTEMALDGAERDAAKSTLQNHPAKSRITDEDVDELFEYFRPFVRKDKQRVVSQSDLAILSDFMNNRVEERGQLQLESQLKKLMQSKEIGHLNSTINLLSEEEQKKHIVESARREQEAQLRLKQNLDSSKKEVQK